MIFEHQPSQKNYFQRNSSKGVLFLKIGLIDRVLFDVLNLKLNLCRLIIVSTYHCSTDLTASQINELNKKWET